MMQSSKRFKTAPDVVCRKVGEESILVPVRHNAGDLDSVFTLSPVAVRIWQLLDGTRDAREIADALSGEFDVDSATALSDVNELLEALRSVDLIVEAN